MASKIQPAAGDETSAIWQEEDAELMKLPVKPIPGDYGMPVIGAIKDRLDFYYFQGQDKFFQARVDKYKSTVVRLNMPPGPIMASNPRVIALLDAKSFPVLFDVSKVEKKDVFTGTYMPSTSLTGGYRVCSYLDPSEANHTKIKQLLFTMLASRKDQVIPTFRTNFSSLFATMESQIASSGKSDFNALNDVTSFDFIGDAYFGVRPSDNSSLGSSGASKAAKWLFFQLCPLMTLGLPMAVEELLLHTFPLPSFLIKSDYKALYEYFNAAAASALDTALKLGLSREEACHNLIFATVFNSYGGLKVLFPGILSCLATSDPKFHNRLAQEIRSAVAADGGKLTFSAIQKMELTNSVVYEALRLDPPVKFQYGHAKKDLIIGSHDASYIVKKGEMLFGYQPCATKDPMVFSNADKFVGDRFLGDEGKKLLKYVVWSNGPETETPTVNNKQCPGKDFVVLVGRLLVAEFFLRYDTFTGEVGKELLGAKVTVTSLTKASAM
ncbi:allene oxide synthase 2-like [Typha latifolia]|uniref:allene oxide synthase 2-like n=1 Tax=Typha latifolia TaxID=4733 RepID=UPI003C2C6524